MTFKPFFMASICRCFLTRIRTKTFVFCSCGNCWKWVKQGLFTNTPGLSFSAFPTDIASQVPRLMLMRRRFMSWEIGVTVVEDPLWSEMFPGERLGEVGSLLLPAVGSARGKGTQ